MKKLLCLLLTLAMLLTMLPAALAEEIKIVETETADDGLIPLIDEPNMIGGACGENLSWTFLDGTLTISGVGEMTDDYGVINPPWYSYRTQITRVVIEEGVTSIGGNAFENPEDGSFYPALKEVVLADSVETIKYGAFRYCKSLTTVQYGKGLKTIGDYAFYHCEKLGSPLFPDVLETIGFCAFTSCDNMSSVVLPDSVTRVDGSAFAACDSLSRVVIGAGVNLLGESSFFNNNNLKTVYFMGGKPAQMYDTCFGYVTATVWYPEGKWTDAQRQDYSGTLTWKAFATSGQCGDDMEWRLGGSMLIIRGKGMMWDFNGKNPGWEDAKIGIQTVAMDYGVESVGDKAFQGCISLRDVRFPPAPSGDDDDWTFSIGDYAFNGCTMLGTQPVVLPDNTDIVGDYAFAFSTLHEIRLNDGLKKLGEGALELTVLESLKIPGTVMELGSMALAGNYALDEITFLCKPFAISSDCCSGVTATAYYPDFDPNWKPSDLQNYGGNLTWKPWVPPTITLSMDLMDTDGVHLSWTALAGADKYRITIETGYWNEDWDLDEITQWVEDTSFLYGPDYLSGWGIPLKMNDNLSFRVEADGVSSNTVSVRYNPFSDVSGAKTLEYLGWAFDHDIVKGTSKTTFSPDDPCSRIQFVMMLWKMHGSPEVGGKNPFSDISGAKTTKAILWALQAGVINSASKFYPDETISRVQIVMILWKLAGSPEVTGTNPFKDVSGTKTTKAVLWAYQNGITKGTGKTTFAPDDPCTRIQLVVFLYKYNNIYHVIPESEG